MMLQLNFLVFGLHNDEYETVEGGAMRKWMDRGPRGEQRRNAWQVERPGEKGNSDSNSDSEGSKDRGLKRVRSINSRTRYRIVSLFSGCSNAGGRSWLKWDGHHAFAASASWGVGAVG